MTQIVPFLKRDPKITCIISSSQCRRHTFEALTLTVANSPTRAPKRMLSHSWGQGCTTKRCCSALLRCNVSCPAVPPGLGPQVAATAAVALHQLPATSPLDGMSMVSTSRIISRAGSMAANHGPAGVPQAAINTSFCLPSLSILYCTRLKQTQHPTAEPPSARDSALLVPLHPHHEGEKPCRTIPSHFFAPQRGRAPPCTCC